MDGLEVAVVDNVKLAYIPLVKEDLRDGHLHLGNGNIHRVVLGHIGVADSRKHIRDRIAHCHCLFLLLTSLQASILCAFLHSPYQLASERPARSPALTLPARKRASGALSCTHLTSSLF
jgi:hypothetical protein